MLRLLAQIAIIVPTVGLFARYQRDTLYWPIVRQVYIDLKEGKKPTEEHTAEELAELRRHEESLREKFGRCWKYLMKS